MLSFPYRKAWVEKIGHMLMHKRLGSLFLIAMTTIFITLAPVLLIFMRTGRLCDYKIFICSC